MASAIMDTVTARLINNNVQFPCKWIGCKVPGIYEVYVSQKLNGAEEKDKMFRL